MSGVISGSLATAQSHSFDQCGMGRMAALHHLNGDPLKKRVLLRTRNRSMRHHPITSAISRAPGDHVPALAFLVSSLDNHVFSGGLQGDSKCEG